MYIVKGNYIFFHIPKTGGKSIYQYFLRRNMLEFAGEHVQYTDFFNNRREIEIMFKNHEIFLIDSMIVKDVDPRTLSDAIARARIEKEEQWQYFLKISENPNKNLKNYNLLTTIRNPIDWYISFYHHGYSMPNKPNSFSNICKLLSFEEFIAEFVEKANIGLYTKTVCNFILPIRINTRAMVKDKEKSYIYNNFDELCPVTFLKIENIKEEMLKYVPEICSGSENDEFLHINKGGEQKNQESREKYLDFFEKSRELLLKKYDTIRDKDKLIFEKAGY